MARDWDRLRAHLEAQDASELRMRYHQIERIIECPLPASKKYPAFWSTSSVYAHHWVAAGFKVSRADCAPDEVRFFRFTFRPPRPVDPQYVRSQSRTSRQPADNVRRNEGRDLVDIVLVGCVKSKRAEPVAAEDLYVSPLFQEARSYARTHARRWFIVSAEHGLLEPRTLVAPYDLYLADASPGYRAAWGRWVVAKLQQTYGSLRGKVVELHAGSAYTDAVRDVLREAGAVPLEPLAGLTFGERLAWYGERAPSPAVERANHASIDTPVNHVRSPIGSVERETSAIDRSISAAILRYRRAHIDTAGRVEFAFTHEATDLLYADPFAYLIGVIFDEGIVAERAWQAPYELKRRLGHLDPYRLRNQPERVREAVARPTSLHRYLSVMADATVRAAAKVCDEYGGDAGRIWAPGTRADEVDRRLREFHKVGQKKAAMAVELLVSRFGVQLEGLDGTAMAYDVHVRRVFLRSGLVDRDTIDDVVAAARRLNPERPGLLDLPTWSIGRQWCRPVGPECSRCPVGDVCRKRVHLNVR